WSLEVGNSISMINLLQRGLLPAAVLFVLVCPLPCFAQDQGSERVSFRGLEQLTIDQAREIISHQMAYIAERGISPARADDAAYLLGIGMRRMGFEEAEVDWEIDGDSVILVVQESKLRSLGEIQIDGNAAIAADVLEALLTDSTRAQMKGVLKSAKLPFVQQHIDQGIAQIRNVYANLGYYDVALVSETENHEELGLVDVRVSVEEGPLYRIESATVDCDTEGLELPLKSLIDEFVKAPYTPGSASMLQGRVVELFNNAGYTGAEIVHLEPDLGNKNAEGEIPVALRLQVTAGARRVLGDVTVTGNQKVAENFFLRRFEPLQGQPYDEGRADRIVRRMLRSGAFSKVELQETPVAESDILKLAILVEETPAREIGTYAGVGSWEGYIIGGTFQHYNLFGAVRRLDTRIEFTSRGMTGDVNVFEPWVLGEKTTLSGGLYAHRRDNDGYTKFELGGQVELSYDFNEYAKLSFFGRATFTDILEHQVVVEELGATSYLTHSGGISFSYDRRDNGTLPTSGFIFNASADVASSVIGSEVDFFRSSSRFTYYDAVGPVRLQAGARAGLMVPLGDTEQLPIDLRHFSGGSSTVRSFPERELGPQDRRGNPIGGEVYTIFNAEASVPVWKGLRFAGFADSGNLLSAHEDISLDDMHHAAGVGLRYDLPIGPIRLDYGWNLNRQEDEPEGAFHFGIGMSF
ncbi:MAG: BamA/TamA family outer membrane protein, partial [Verrucomicrobia bacterium]|nr:BamA/TamA family outer membrane protein [Verrucomicrobiota bacterium]